MAEEPLYHVFVSHATYDKFVAKAICDRIEQMGLTTFRDDRDIQGGSVISEEIMTAIERSCEVVVLLTPESVNRMWVAMEIGMALLARRRIVPLFCHLDPNDFPDVLRVRRGYDLDRIEEYLNDLRTRYAETAK